MPRKQIAGKTLPKRRELLQKLGYDHLNAQTTERLRGQITQFCEESARGQRSPEGDFVETSRRQLKRAIGLGYTSLADRNEHDISFIERMTEHGITLQDIYARDVPSRGHPPRVKALVDFGVGLKTANDLEVH